jgi:hypothetical protein
MFRVGVRKVLCAGSGGEELEFEHLGSTEYYCNK